MSLSRALVLLFPLFGCIACSSHKTMVGFPIDPVSGYWGKENAGDGEKTSAPKRMK